MSVIVSREVQSRREAADYLSHLRIQQGGGGWQVHTVDFFSADREFADDRIPFDIFDDLERLRFIRASSALWLSWWTGGPGRRPPPAAPGTSHWTQRALRVESIKKDIKSLTKPWLYFCTVVDPRLFPLLDHRRECVIKSVEWQPHFIGVVDLGRVYESVIEFSRDALVGWILRGLTTDYPMMVTPHFATALDAFAGPAMDETGAFTPVAAGNPPRLYTVTERAKHTLFDYAREHLRGDPDLVRHMTYIVWAVLFSMDAAGFCYGLIHGDLHTNNIMVRDVTGTPYENKSWAYRHRDMPDQLVVVPPAQHRNKMVEIIDFGRSKIRARYSRDAARTPEMKEAQHEDAENFIDWMQSVLINAQASQDDQDALMLSQLSEGFPDHWLDARLMVQGLERRDIPNQPLPPDLLLIAFMPMSATPPAMLSIPSGGRRPLPVPSEEEQPPPKLVRTEQCAACHEPGVGRILAMSASGGGLGEDMYCSRVCAAVHHGYLAVHRPPLSSLCTDF